MNSDNLPNIAVLMATFNGARFIEEQIKSITEQEGVNVNIYISDDLSRDKTVMLIKNSIYKQRNQITLLPEVIASGGAGQNFFRLVKDVPLGEYEYFAFSDQDDIWQAKKILRAVNQLKINNADGYSSSVVAFFANGGKKFIKKDYPQKKYDYFFEGPGPGCTFVMSRKLFISLRDFLIKNHQEMGVIYYHDWFIYAFARTNNFKWLIDSQSHILYRQHESNDTGVNIGLLAAFLRVKVVWSFWARDQAYTVARLLDYEEKMTYYLSRNTRGILRLCTAFVKFRRSTKDGLVLLFLGLAGRLSPPSKPQILKK